MVPFKIKPAYFTLKCQVCAKIESNVPNVSLKMALGKTSVTPPALYLCTSLYLTLSRAKGLQKNSKQLLSNMVSQTR